MICRRLSLMMWADFAKTARCLSPFFAIVTTKCLTDLTKCFQQWKQFAPVRGKGVFDVRRIAAESAAFKH